MSQTTKQVDNVKIPVTLLNDVVSVFETLSCSDYTPDFRNYFDNVFSALQHKKETMALREIYSKIVYAKDDDERFEARLKYLQERQRIKGQNRP